MAAVKQYKSTVLTTVVLGLLVFFGVGGVVDPDSSSGQRAVGVLLLVVGAAAGVGLWSLATERLKVAVAQALIAAGLVAAGAFAIEALVEDFGFFVWVFGPMLVLAGLAFWYGILNSGLQSELSD